MTRRLPALPPEPPERRRGPEPGPDAPDRPLPGGFDRGGHPDDGPAERERDRDRDEREDGDGDEQDWIDDPADDELIDPSAWPDDPDDDDALLPGDAELERAELEHLPSLEDLGDDGVEDDVDLPPDDGPLEDDLDDLDAPDDADVPVLAWSLTVGVDGRRVDATVDPSRARTTWLRAGASPGLRVVTLEIAGVSVRADVDCALPSGDAAESVVLGRDVLAGRFLLRP